MQRNERLVLRIARARYGSDSMDGKFMGRGEFSLSSVDAVNVSKSSHLHLSSR